MVNANNGSNSTKPPSVGRVNPAAASAPAPLRINAMLRPRHRIDRASKSQNPNKKSDNRLRAMPKLANQKMAATTSFVPVEARGTSSDSKVQNTTTAARL